MNRNQIIQLLDKSKPFLKERFKIIRIGLFGSYATGLNTNTSDVDIIFDLEVDKTLGLKDLNEMEVFFSKLFKIKDVDLINSKYVNPIIKHEINKTVIYV